MKRLLLLALAAGFTVSPLAASIIRDDVPDQEYLELANNIGVYAAGSNYPDFSSACAIAVNGEHQGSGVLIAPQYVLTAAHVLWDDPENPFPGQTALTISFGPGVGEYVESVDSVSYVLHPAWVASFSTPGMDETILLSSGVDIALIKLERPVAITPAAWNFGVAEALGAELFTSGYGFYGTGSSGQLFLDEKKRSIENVADRILSQLPVAATGYQDLLGGVIALDFDNPAGTSNTLQGTPIGLGDVDVTFLGDGTSLPTAKPLEGTPASGDSGGPWYMKFGDDWKVVAVESFGNQEDEIYGDISVGTRVANYTNWIVPEMSKDILGETFGGGNGWVWKNNAGFFFAASIPWFYHFELGWCYPATSFSQGMWFYRVADASWYYTTEEVLPLAVNATTGQWGEYFTPNP